MDEQVLAQPVAPWAPVLVLDPSTELKMRAQLATKISKCYGLISAVMKTGFNTQNNYKFASTEAIYGQVRSAAAESGIAIVPLMGEHEETPLLKDDGARRGSYLKVFYTICVIDTDTGYTISIPWIGEVMEYGDKAFNKASTAAMKYALRTLFLIPTDATEDADAQTHSDRPPRARSSKNVTQQAPQPEAAQRVDPEHSVYLKSLKISTEQVSEFKARCRASQLEFAKVALAARDAGVSDFDALMAFVDQPIQLNASGKQDKGWSLTDAEVEMATQIATESGHAYMSLIAAASASGVRDIEGLRIFAATFGSEVKA